MNKVKLYANMQPYQWQLDTHNYITNLTMDNQHIIVIKAARQRYGKSAFCKAELLRHSLSKVCINAYISPTLKLAGKMMKEIIQCIPSMIKRTNSIDMMIEFTNGSIIRFFSAEMGNALRGFTINGVMVLDEAAFIKDDVYYELLSSWVVVHKALTIMVSSPQYKQGFFYDMFINGLTDNKYITTLDWVTEYNAEFDEFTLAQQSIVPRQKWRSEYLGQFLDADGSVFSEFDNLLMNVLPKYKELYIGIDFGTGSGKDYTVLTAFNEIGEQCLLWKCNDLSAVQQIDKIVSILSNNRQYVKRIFAEGNSIGKIYLDLLRKKSNMVITEFTTTNDSKRKLVEQLQVALEQSSIRLINDREQTNQLSFYESKVNTTTNTVSYNAPNGMHDDYVMALMLAYNAYNKKNNNYRVSIL